MCLDRVFRGKEKREALAKLPERFYVWKHLCRKDNGSWRTEYSFEVVSSGQMKASYLGKAAGTPGGYTALVGTRAYKAGWHAIVSKSRPDGYNTKCWAEKRHIRAVGLQGKQLCVVLSHITFPKKCGQPKKEAGRGRAKR